MVAEARAIFVDDVPLVAVEGSKLLGTMTVVFPNADPTYWTTKVRRSAAKRGGTHAFIVYDEPVEHVEVSVDEGAQAALGVAEAFEGIGAAMQGQQAVDRLEVKRALRGPRPTPTKTTRVKERVVSVLVIRMPRDKWGELPKELRPDPTPWEGELFGCPEARGSLPEEA